MTLPEQSNRAVRQTREFLVRLASPYGENGIKGIRREVRAEALRLLRHYPYAWAGDCPDGDTPEAHATPSKCSARDGCTLTDEEREAIEGAIDAEYGRGAWQWAATLRLLLERL